MRQGWADYRVFWREFRQTFHTTGAVLPSGRALGRALARYVRDGEGRDGGRRILEVGPGTGAVTQHVVAAMRNGDWLELVERNAEFVARLRSRLAEDATYQRAADRIRLHHASLEAWDEVEQYNVIISGLPLNNFSVESVAAILAKLGRLLAPGGTLSFFEYVAIRQAKAALSRPAERQRMHQIGRLLGEFLDGREIRRDWVWSNVPPAWVHHVRLTAGGIEPGAGSRTPSSLLPAPRSPLP